MQLTGGEEPEQFEATADRGAGRGTWSGARWALPAGAGRRPPAT